MRFDNLSAVDAELSLKQLDLIRAACLDSIRSSQEIIYKVEAVEQIIADKMRREQFIDDILTVS